ncbi:hypothetical protein FRC03_002119 [Tulasnella sp. 419]|nr:hypothetical protein FRC03_002119 [Tulasnella sp. 419]
MITTSPSPGALTNALAILVEDMKPKAQDHCQAPKTTSCIVRLEEEANLLQSILECFSQHLSQKITKIRQQRNSLVPVHRLPDEILQNILHIPLADNRHAMLDPSFIHVEHVPITQFDRSGESNRDKLPYSLAINMVATCSRWYQLALSTPRLWSYVDIAHPLELTEVLLTRSKHVPLHISGSRSRTRNTRNTEHEGEFMKLIAPHLHRSMSIDIDYCTSNIFELLPLGRYSTPLLESFVIHNSYSVDSIPSFILHSSGLRDLHIVGMRCPWGHSAPSGLTHLSISTFRSMLDMEHDDMVPFEMNDFQLLFSASPCLRTVFLQGLGVLSDHYPLENRDRFSFELPALESIIFDAMDPQTVTSLLLSIIPKHGSYPSITVVGDWENWELNALAPIQPGCLLDVTVRGITWLSIGRNRLKAGRESNGVRSTLLKLPADNHESCWNSVASLLRSDGTSVIRDMEVELYWLMFEDDQISMTPKLHLYPCLQHLTINMVNLSEFSAQCLTQVLYSPATDHNPQGLPLPRLKQLTWKETCNLKTLVRLIRARRKGEDEQRLTPIFMSRLERIDVEVFRPEANKYPTELMEELNSHFQEWDVALNVTFYCGIKFTGRRL